MTAGGEMQPVRHSSVQLLADVARRIGASLDLQQTLDAVAMSVVEALEFETAVVNLVVDGGDLQAVAVAGSPEAKRVLLGHRWKRELCDALFDAAEVSGPVHLVPGREMLRVTEAHPELQVWVPDMEVKSDENAWHPLDACFAAMTSSNGELLGVLSVDMPRDGMRPDGAKRELLSAFAVHAALALEHADMHSRLRDVERRLRHEATHDALTGLPNRALVLQELDTALGSHGALPPGVAFAFCDLDTFKEVNDSYGHAVGDAVLQEVARLLRGAIRPSDIVGRFGGDEFVVVCRPVSCIDDATAIAERISVALSEPIVLGARSIMPSLSMGLSVSRAGSTREVLMAEADAALYDAKARGGACWTVYRDGVSGASRHSA